MANPTTQTGPVSDLEDFFTKLNTFMTSGLDLAYQFTAVATTSPQNMTKAGAPTGATTSYAVRCWERGGHYWWIRYNDDPDGGIYGMVAKSGGTALWHLITDRPQYDVKISPVITGGEYRFTGVDDMVYAVGILPNGNHLHIWLGKMGKVGSWVGGEIFTGSWQNLTNGSSISSPWNVNHRFMSHIEARTVSLQENAVMHCEYNGKDFALLDSTFNVNASEANYNLATCLGGFVRPARDISANFHIDPDYSPNIFNQRSAGLPIEYQLLRDADDKLYYDLGNLPGVRFVNMELLNPGDTINTDWVVYPISIKTDTGVVGQYVAGKFYGVAYKVQ